MRTLLTGSSGWLRRCRAPRLEVAGHGVEGFNTDRADTLASFERFLQIARSLGAAIIIQHEPLDIPRLPAFPQAAR